MGRAVKAIILAVDRLRGLQLPRQGEPVLVFVGMPNVGKSSLITAVSSAAPKINNYPFTTRGLLIGEVDDIDGQYQVMDTPGVLERPDGERNRIENLTLAAMENLPCTIVYVLDLSGTSGAQS